MKPFENIKEVKEKICGTGLFILFIITIPSLVASLLRIINFGWQPPMILHIICVSVVILMAKYRDNLSYTLKAGGIVTLVFIVGVGELLYYGILGAGGAYLTFACVIAGILFNSRFSIALFSVSTLIILIDYFLYNHNLNGIKDLDIISYAQDWSAWGNFYFDYLLIWASIIAAFYYISSALTSSIKELEYKVAQRTQELEKLATTDTLTGLNNRLQIDHKFTLELEKAKRYNLFFSIIIIDIDKFKNINDNHGHLVGDKVLVEFSTILRNSCRKIDTIGRWGGEEFLIICPQTHADAAATLTEKIRKNITEYNFSQIGNVSASFGITEYQPQDEIDQIMKRADTALYNAKNKGRNRIEVIP